MSDDTTAPDEVIDSPWGWVRKHIDSYVSTGGQEGHMWRGLPTLLITTTGRRSGQRRRTALLYGRHGQDYVIVASKGGSPEHPSWFLNIQSDPAVEVQVGPEVFQARARLATDAERPALWNHMAEILPDYNEYQAKTDRTIPVLVLSRLD